jgi:hypothetical protein
VGELEASLGVREFDQWHSYYLQEPWGAWRDNVHAGLIAAAVANFSTRKLKRPATFDDFLLKQKDDAKAANRGRLLGLFRMAGVKKKGKRK